MSVKILDQTISVERDLEIKASVFLRLMAESIVSSSQARTPKKTGRLRADVNKQTLGLSGKVIWGKKYAGRMEEEQFKNYTTPGTGPHYARDGVKKGIDQTSAVAKSAGLI